ncbi:enhancer of split m5 protein-like [Teleopsis dalmanni]|uniref:Enhancer of split region protein HLHm5a n=1 Tax=Teleopsis dalmanni TaxID=139649 RepID=G9I1M0_TELDL|nr:enhancer of split m5 protein-like [Teleopsis dalmanni]AEV91206.1 enhancer of split region protein HLHm5a [Teleopsis dalmanni]
MCAKVEYISKTQHYLKVKKPLLERQRRARMNKCLDALKTLVAELQSDDAILRMDKAEMLETTIVYMRSQAVCKLKTAWTSPPMDSFCNGYMNAVNEVSRVMAATPGMSVELGKSVMSHLGVEFNRLLQHKTQQQHQDTLSTKSHFPRPVSPASSGYHSDCDESSMATPVLSTVWRPW